MEEHAATFLNAIVHAEPEWLRDYLTANSLSALLVALLVLVLGVAATRRMKLRPTSGLQAITEWLYESLVGFCEKAIGPGGADHAPFLGTLFVYIFFANLLGIVPGFISPTSSLTTTIALAIPTIVYVQIVGFRVQGMQYLMHFVGEPWWLFPINIPIHIIGELAKPLSLSVRLFGNIFGEDIVIAKLLMMGGAIFAATYLPLPVHLPVVVFHILISFVQAMVFFMLSAAYIAQVVESHGDEHGQQRSGQPAGDAPRHAA